MERELKFSSRCIFNLYTGFIRYLLPGALFHGGGSKKLPVFPALPGVKCCEILALWKGGRAKVGND